MFPFLFTAVVTLQIGPIDSDVPARQPQMAANESMVGLTFGAGKTIYFSASRDSGKSFSAPIRVAEAEILPLGRHRGPRIVLSGNAIVISAVTGRKLAQGPHAHGLPSDGDLWAWRSVDGGKSWSQGIRVNDVPAAAPEGMHALAGDAKGNLFAVWLDHRSGHGHKLYGARSTDGGLTWSKNVQVYASPEGTICECCHPSAVVGPDGQILIMWRNWLEGARDLYLARSRDGVNFAKAEKLGTGTWPLKACPMDGGGLAVSQNGVVTAWRRDAEIFLAKPGEQEISLGKGRDVAVASGTAGVYAVWSGPDGIIASLPAKKTPDSLAPKGSFPNVVALPAGGALVAWEVDGKITLQQVQ